jgi:ATP-dependent RNA helicase RhlE
MTTAPTGGDSFSGLGIAPAILEVLDRNKYTVPTPIQKAAIPGCIEGKDMIGVAQTGTGKTLAFGIPMIQAMLQGKGHGLVVLPTRELALQVDETLQKIGGPLGVRTAVLIGGASMNLQRNMIRNKPHIVVATPGRLIDHLEQKTITLKAVAVLVLDEADRMLDMGFAPQINKILAEVPKTRQTMLFSATMPTEIVSIATKHMQLPLRVEVATQGTTAERVEQEIIIARRDMKTQLLQKLLTDHAGSVLVFSRTKHGAKKITSVVKAMGHTAAEIHSNRSLAQRRESLDGFKSGKYRVLVATDIAARGIDVTGIELVVNYDLPQDPADYVHRIGRTGRAGRSGKAVSFALPEQAGDIRSIERLTRTKIPTKFPSDLGELPALSSSVEAVSWAREPRESSGGHHRGGPGGSRSGPPRRGSGGGGSRGGGFRRGR